MGFSINFISTLWNSGPNGNSQSKKDGKIVKIRKLIKNSQDFPIKIVKVIISVKFLNIFSIMDISTGFYQISALTYLMVIGE